MTLLELFALMRERLRLVIALPLVCALAVGLFSLLFMPDTYTASTSMYVLTKANNSDTLTSNELTASQQLTNDVATLLKSSRLKNDTAKTVGLSSLNGYDIGVTSQTTTRVITLSVEGPNAATAASIANAMATDVSQIAQQVMDVQSVNVIDQAVTPDAPSGPPRLMYTAVAFLAGLFLAIAIVVLLDMMNTRVRDSKDVEKLLDVPVIARFPMVGKGGR